MARKNEGFTLIEVIVVMVIIGILTAVTATGLSYYNKDKDVVNGVNTIISLASFAQKYAINNSTKVGLEFIPDSGGLKILVFLDKDNNFQFSTGDQLLKGAFAPNIDFAEVPEVSGNYVVPCGNMLYTPTLLLSREKEGKGICYSPSIVQPILFFNSLGIPADVFGGVMLCKGFLVLAGTGSSNKLYGIEFSQSGFVKSCKWNGGKQRWVE